MEPLIEAQRGRSGDAGDRRKAAKAGSIMAAAKGFGGLDRSVAEAVVCGKARCGLGVVSKVGEDEGALGAPTSLRERQEALMKAVMLQRGPFDLQS